MKEIPIWEIEGFKIGHAQDEIAATGCTVVLCEGGASAGVDVRGGAPASRETELLRSVNMVDRIHGVMLSGGSAFGLDAGAGAMKWLEARGVGFDVGVAVVPIVCGAALFDLVVGDPSVRPDQKMGYEACEAAGGPVAEGNAGAGIGAAVGKYLGTDRMMKSGLGTYAVSVGGIQCGAVVAVNALGDVFDLDTGRQLAGILNEEKTGLDSTTRIMTEEIQRGRNVFSGNTTIGCILTNGALTKPQANKLASLAHNGLARVIRPVHTSVDGDSIFALSSGQAEVSPDGLGVLAAEVMARAVNRAVLTARSAYGLTGAAELLSERAD